MLTDEEFDAFVSSAVEELERKQSLLTEKYGIGTYARFLFDQPSATLRFFDESGTVRLRAAALPLGSYSEGSGTWKWAWANDTIVQQLRDHAGRLRELYELTGMEAFKNPAFEAEPEMAWQTAAMAIKHLGALGCYVAAGGNSDLYLAVTSILPAE